MPAQMFRKQTPPLERGGSLTVEALRMELEAFTRETLRRELEQLKAGIVGELQETLQAQEVQPKQGAPVACSYSSERSSKARLPQQRSQHMPTLLQSSTHLDPSPRPSKPTPDRAADEPPAPDRSPLLGRPALIGMREKTEYLPGLSAFDRLSLFVRGSTFETWTGCAVLGSVLWLAVQTQYMAVRWLDKPPLLFWVVEVLFCIVFAAEIALRTFVGGLATFFCGPERLANRFDFGLVAMQVGDITADSLGLTNSSLPVAPFLRVLRLVRVIRLVRVFKIVPDLRMLLVSVFQSMRPLVWVFALVFMVTSIFGIIITVEVNEYKTSFHDGFPQEQQLLEEYFGALDKTMVTLYGAISGGRDWRTSAEPLMEFVNPNLVYLFVAYTFFVIFAMMNVITSQFVDSALEASAKDRREVLASKLMDTFYRANGKVTKEVFMGYLEDPSMKDFLKDLYRRDEVSPQEIKESRLFEMLDADNSQTITKEELVLGCVKLTGTATSLDLAVLKLDVKKLGKDIKRLANMVKIVASAAIGDDEMSPTCTQSISLRGHRQRRTEPDLVEDGVGTA